LGIEKSTDDRFIGGWDNRNAINGMLRKATGAP